MLRLAQLRTIILLLAACGAPEDGSATTDASLGGSSSGSSTSTSTASTSSSAAATTEEPTTAPPGSSSGDATTSTTTTTSTTGDATTGTDTSTTGAPACPGGGLAPGKHDIMIEWDGIQRAAIVVVPKGYDDTSPVPLVLNIHGLTSNAGQQQIFSGMDPTADAEGFVLAYPNGIGSSWNAGACCGTAQQQMVDDVGFLRALVEHLETLVCIDPARVYATGMSNGGFMSNRLGCEAADLFAAIGPVSATLLAEDCAPARPIPVLMFNGTGDALVPYNGGLFQGAQQSFQDWAQINGCVGDPVPGKSVGAASCETYDQCEAGVSVTLCTIEGMGHCWPGQPVCPFGVANTDLKANDELWAFFSQYSLP